jgi:hypothetical protein
MIRVFPRRRHVGYRTGGPLSEVIEGAPTFLSVPEK